MNNGGFDKKYIDFLDQNSLNRKLNIKMLLKKCKSQFNIDLNLQVFKI